MRPQLNISRKWLMSWECLIKPLSTFIFEIVLRQRGVYQLIGNRLFKKCRSPQGDQMKKAKQKMLEKKGWQVGPAEEFLETDLLIHQDVPKSP